MSADPTAQAQSAAPAVPGPAPATGLGWRETLRSLQQLARAHAVGLSATAVFLGWAAFYGLCLYPGHGGELNAGDSIKFQILGHTPILVHGPGYPLVLLIGVVVRWLALPLPAWWVMTFALSALPGALANTFAFLLTRRLTGHSGFALAASLLLGSAGLVAVQATEAEVYALTLAFVFAVVLLLCRFVASRQVGDFLAACGVYAMSFGNHLMMIMLVGVFVVIAVAYRRQLWQPRALVAALGLIVLGASQYLFLVFTAYDPRTAYSEYMPLPPEPLALMHYVLGTYFSDLYGSGLDSTRNLEALQSALRSAHPWLSLPLLIGGVALLLAGWRRRDRAWFGLVLLLGAGLSFVPFVLWYGAYDIRAFHAPVLGPLLVVSVATLGWWLRRSPGLGRLVAIVLVSVGLVRAAQTGWLLSFREPAFSGVATAVTELVHQAPTESPVVAMSYGLRMATLYEELQGRVPGSTRYRVHWRAISETLAGDRVGGIVVPTDGHQFVAWIRHHRPDLQCRTWNARQPATTHWPAYLFDCRTPDAS